MYRYSCIQLDRIGLRVFSSKTWQPFAAQFFWGWVSLMLFLTATVSPSRLLRLGSGQQWPKHFLVLLAWHQTNKHSRGNEMNGYHLVFTNGRL